MLEREGLIEEAKGARQSDDSISIMYRYNFEI